VLENSAAWIDPAGIIIIELHDSYKQVAVRRFIRQLTGLTSAGIVAKQLSLAAKPMVARSRTAWTRTRPGVTD
jgi:hypothetical protein